MDLTLLNIKSCRVNFGWGGGGGNAPPILCLPKKSFFFGGGGGSELKFLIPMVDFASHIVIGQVRHT